MSERLDSEDVKRKQTAVPILSWSLAWAKFENQQYTRFFGRLLTNSHIVIIQPISRVSNTRYITVIYVRYVYDEFTNGNTYVISWGCVVVVLVWKWDRYCTVAISGGGYGNYLWQRGRCTESRYRSCLLIPFCHTNPSRVHEYGLEDRYLSKNMASNLKVY